MAFDIEKDIFGPTLRSIEKLNKASCCVCSYCKATQTNSFNNCSNCGAPNKLSKNPYDILWDGYKKVSERK